MRAPLTSAQLTALIARTDFSASAATLIGYGNMGKEYLKGLRALGVGQIRVCSRAAGPLEELRGVAGVEATAGGFERLKCCPQPGELGIVTTPIASLISTAEHLLSLGFRRFLVEKPVSLWSTRIEQLAEKLERHSEDAVCAYNRVAYPSFHEVLDRSAGEGGITSCAYTFTEWIRPDWSERFSPEVLARWGIANSLHVISMAHALIGLPKHWMGYRSGSLPWHPTGTVFVGSGISQHGIPFSYHADWGSTGHWSVEVNTSGSSYRLCPLEKLFRKVSPISDWEEISTVTFSSGVKAGVVEQLAAMLSCQVREHIPLVSLRKAAALAKYGEQVFGYPAAG